MSCSALMFGIVPVARPANRVLVDIPPTPFEVVFVAHDVLVSVALPESPVVGRPARTSNAIAIAGGGERLESMNHIGQG